MLLDERNRSTCLQMLRTGTTARFLFGVAPRLIWLLFAPRVEDALPKDSNRPPAGGMDSGLWPSPLRAELMAAIHGHHPRYARAPAASKTAPAVL